jgi:hypothetical protein
LLLKINDIALMSNKHSLAARADKQGGLVLQEITG